MHPRDPDDPRGFEPDGDGDGYDDEDSVYDGAADFMDYGPVDDAGETPTEDLGELSFEDDEFTALHYDSSGIPIGPRRIMPITEEASPLVQRYLFPTEKFRGEWRKHWTYLADQFAYGALATFVFGWLWGYSTHHHWPIWISAGSVVLWIGVMGWVSVRVLDWYYDRFILTNKRLMKVSGMVTRTVGMMPLTRVTDMKYQQSAWGRIFGYGDFILESAGQEQALREVKHLPNPNELYLRIVEEMYEPEAVEAKLSAAAAEEDGS